MKVTIDDVTVSVLDEVIARYKSKKAFVTAMLDLHGKSDIDLREFFEIMYDSVNGKEEEAAG